MDLWWVAAALIRVKPHLRALPAIGFASCAASTAFLVCCVGLTADFYKGYFCGSSVTLSYSFSVQFGFVFLCVALAMDTVWALFLATAPLCFKSSISTTSQAETNHLIDGR